MSLFIPGVIILLVFIFLYQLSKGPDNNERQKAKVLKDILPELRFILKQSDIKSGLRALIEKYKKTVQKYEYFEEGGVEPEQQVERTTIAAPVEKKEEEIVAKIEKPVENGMTFGDVSKLWSAWYSDNSINLLLYIGAFFIVASASIFVGFQWGTIEGIIKALAFSLFTAAFLLCGFVFYRFPAVKTAGFTFISIAAILTPFNGVAWHNFYLAPAGYPVGTSWMVTSFVSVALYFFLMLYFKNRLFSYISAVGILSLTLSFINVSSLQLEFYILGAIFAAFILFLAGIGAAKSSYKSLEVGVEPFGVSSQVVMPLSLVFGFYFGATHNMLFTFPTAIALFLSAAFYVVSYLFDKKIIYLLVIQLLLPLGVYCMLKASLLETPIAVIITQIVPLLLLGVRKFITDKDGYFVYESNIAAIALTCLSLMANGVYSLNALFISFTLFILGIHFLVSYYVEPKLDRLIIAFCAFPAGLYSLLRYAGVDMSLTMLVIQVISIGYVAFAGQLKKNAKVSQAFFYLSMAVVFISGIGGIIATNSTLKLSFGYLSMYSLVFCVYFFVSYYFFRLKWLFAGIGITLIILIYCLCRFAGLSILVSLNVVQAMGIGYMLFAIFTRKTNSAQSSISLTIANVAIPSIAGFVLINGAYASIFRPEVVFSSFTGVVYYALSYVLTERKTYQYIAEFAFLWFVYLLLNWLNIPSIMVLYVISGVCGVYVAVSQLVKNRGDQTINIGIAGSVFVFMYAFIVSANKVELMYLSIFPMIYALVGYLSYKTILNFGVHVFFQLVACYLFVFYFLNVEAKYEYLGAILISVSAIHYVISYIRRMDRTANYLFLAGVGINALWAVVLTVGFPKTGFAINLLVAGMAFHYHIFQRVKYGLYIGNAFLILSIYQFLNGWDILRVFHPLIFIGVFVVEYGISTIFSGKKFARELRSMALVGAIVAVIYFFFRSNIEPEIKLTALISSYFLTALFAFDAWYVREKYYGYLASAIGMMSYFWQVHYLGQTEYQIYLLPLGVYFMVLSYFTRKEKNQDITHGLEYGGLFVLLVPLLFQSFGDKGFYYSLLLGAEGIILMALGITTKRKLYTYVGVGAIVSGVFSQTYNYVFTLPRWISTAIAGITFIAVAVFLLIKRKDISSEQKK